MKMIMNGNCPECNSETKTEELALEGIWVVYCTNPKCNWFVKDVEPED